MGDGNVTAVQLGTGTNVTLETGLVKITGGTPGEGKVLTSDAAGLASWTSPTPAQQVLTGSITSFAGATLPPSSGYLICDGSAVSRTTYANLFLVIGTTYGTGDGTTTFNLPDLRGRTIIGTGQGDGLTNRKLASTGGEELHTLSEDEMPKHSHEITDPGHKHKSNVKVIITSIMTSNNFFLGQEKIVGGYDTDSTADASTGISIGSSGVSQPYNTMSPYISLNYIIKY